MPKFQPIQNFDGLSPQTTKGDLISRSSTAAVRVAVGSDGTFLKADSTQSSGVVWSSATGGGLAVRSVTTTDTCTNADDVLLLSGASFTETLFTAVGNTGKVIRIIHSGTSLTQVYTLVTTSSQTIGGIASGSYALYTNGEALTVISDGANWQILDHKTNAGAAYALTVGATTTAPGMGPTIIQNFARWSRSGSYMVLQYSYMHTGGSGADGSGAYKYPLPSGASIDLTKVTAPSGANLPNASGAGFGGSVVGPATIATTGSGNANYIERASVIVFDATNLYMLGAATAAEQSFPFGSVLAARFSAVNFTVSFTATIPIAGWQP